MPANRPRVDLSYDIGFIPSNPVIRIGNYVFIDVNRDGLQDAGDTPVSGATVTLRCVTPPPGCAFTPNTATTTTVNGFYNFTSGATMLTQNALRANEQYELVIGLTGPLANHQATRSFRGTNAAIDSNGQHTSALVVSAPVAALSLGETNEDYDFGFIPQYTVGDRVFNDNDGNGCYDAGVDTPIDGVTVTLSGGTLTAPRTTLTNAMGIYTFASLGPASSADIWAETLQAGTTYTISIRPGEVPNTNLSPANTCGGDDTRDSDGVRVPPTGTITSIDQVMFDDSADWFCRLTTIVCRCVAISFQRQSRSDA